MPRDMFKDVNNLFGESENEEKRSWGLDFGTFRSFIATKVENNSPECIVPEQQIYRKGIPSLFWHPDKKLPEYRDFPSEMICGEVISANAEVADPDGVCSSVKMHLTEETVRLHGTEYKPEYIAGKIVDKIVRITKDTMIASAIPDKGFYDKIVVGVPVRFGAVEREKIHNIVKKVGFHQVELLSEPMAAALYIAKEQKAASPKILVFDCGAGTFDTTLLVENSNPTEKEPYPYKVVDMNGSDKAGDALDEAMIKLVLKKLKEKLGNGVGGSFNLNALQEGNADYRALKYSARMAKEALSDAEYTTVMVTGNDFGYTQVMVTRKEYEQEIYHIVNSNIDLVEELLKKYGMLNAMDLQVIMVGGSCYIPYICRRLTERLSGINPGNICLRAPEYAVALGCAVYAEMPAFARKVMFGYATETINRENHRSMLWANIPSNIELPYSFTREHLTAHENQTQVTFSVYQISGIEKVNEWYELADGKYTNIKLVHEFHTEVEKGTVVTLTTKVDESGILTLTCDDHGISPYGPTTITANLGANTI